jgi:glycine dehydrogenase
MYVLAQNIALVKTRGEALGMEIVVGDAEAADFSKKDFCGALVQVQYKYAHIKLVAAIAE